MLVDQLNQAPPTNDEKTSGGDGKEGEKSIGEDVQDNSSSRFRRPRRPGQDGSSSWIIKKNNLP